MTATPLTPSTTNPCPSWCELPAGHGYDSTSLDGTCSYRCHQLTLAEAPASKSTVYADIIASEVAIGVPDEPIEPVSCPAIIEAPHIYFDAGTAELTADEASAIADMLIRAAAKLRSIENGDQQ